ncbi:MAG TPA: hypothetical protein VII87_08195 [Solirubrobacteraceae bacterium]
MSDVPPQISILDARLAEIDKRLRTIQTGLVTDERAAPAPDRGTPRAGTRAAPETPEASRAPDTVETPALPPRVEVPEPGATLHAVPPPPPGDAQPGDAQPGDALVDAIDELRELATSHHSLLASMRSLLGDYEHALAEARSASAPAPHGDLAQPLTVTAGPFASTDAVRSFERALASLPGVSAVELRGYEGGDRAIVDVHLSAPTS